MENRFEIRGRNTAIFLTTKDGKEIETLISTDDLEKVRDFIGKWYPAFSKSTNSYYVMGYGGKVNGEKKTTSLHRWIMGDPLYYVIDHINHDTLNNCYPNLRIVSQSINMLNKRNTGVVKYKDVWKAQFTFEGEKYQIGYYKTEEEARKRLSEVKEYFIEEQRALCNENNDTRFFVDQVVNGGIFDNL